MSCFRSTPLVFLLVLFVCPAIASSHIFSDHNPETEYGGATLWQKWRFLSDESGAKSSMILAAKETHRKDPLNKYDYYTGGWNISNPHYWGSVAFTAFPFFGIAVVWFVTFALCLFIICICHCCCQKDPYSYSRVAYALSLAFLILVTFVAILGCRILYTGQGKFYSSTSSTLQYIVKQANTTVENLRSVSTCLDSAERIAVDASFLAPNIQTEIDNVRRKINSAASTLSMEADENAEQIQHVLNVMMVLIVIAAVMLLLAFSGFVLSIFGMRRLVYLLILVGWILVTGTFILCGVFLILHNAVSDTCIAMDEWVKNPTAHTALDDILPCVDNATAQETLLRAKEVTYQLVFMVDKVILNVTNGDYPPELKPLYFNQSGPLMPVLCNPYNSDLSVRKCSAGEVNLENVNKVWKNYVCNVSVSQPGICTTIGRLTPAFYEEISAAVNVTYGLYRYAPFLVDLQDCAFVRQTFSDIIREHCPSLRRYTQWVYIGLVVVSAAVMLSLVFWVIYARERKHRVSTRRVVANSSEYQNK